MPRYLYPLIIRRVIEVMCDLAEAIEKVNKVKQENGCDFFK